MASTFENIKAQSTSAGSTLRAVPPGATWIIIGFMVSNISGTLETFTITAGGTILCQDIPLPAGSAVSILDGKVVLKEGESIDEICSADAGADYFISYMEKT